MPFPVFGSALPYAKKLREKYTVYSRTESIRGGDCIHELNVVDRKTTYIYNKKGERVMWEKIDWHKRGVSCEETWKDMVVSLTDIIAKDVATRNPISNTLKNRLEALL